ncbi:MAG TPA: FAD-dependent oxidoreductase [Stellaceae bacterium]|nr:FAD-dependent oxidoreductase [Stellaceae bacterium]
MSGEILVIGGGLAGAAAAAHLARAGRQVTLVERERGPHDKVCGEFLAPQAQLSLEELGIDIATLGAAPIACVRLAAGDDVIERQLPFPAVGLPRRVLDEAVLRRAGDCGADIRRGCRVVALSRSDSGWQARLDSGEIMTARTVVLATGKHDLRGFRRPAGLHRDLVGFRQHFTLSTSQAAALGGSVELALFSGGYAGLQPAGEGRANLCLVVRGGVLLRLGSWPALLEAIAAEVGLLAKRLDGAVACGARPSAVASIPYGAVRWRAGGLWRVGDQAAVMPSFAGEGMALALRSAELAAAMLCRGMTPEAFQRRLAMAAAPRVVGASVLSHLLVAPAGQRIAMVLGRLCPPLLSGTARATRLPLLTESGFVT